jgi:amidase
MTDLCHLPAHELVQRIAAGEVSCREVIQAHNLVVFRCGTSRDRLPIAVQVAARPSHDVTALAVAAHLENVFGGWQPPPMARPGVR